VREGDILAIAVPASRCGILGGLLGGTLWAVWLLVLGVLLLRRAARVGPGRAT
jgi:hypothetical protein